MDQRSQMKIFNPAIIPPSTRSFIYVASPYSKSDEKKREDRYLGVCATCAYFVKMGYTVYSPIAHWHPIAKAFGLPIGMEFWRSHDLTMLSKAWKMVVAMIQGWNESDGIEDEVRFAHNNGIPVEYFDTEALRL